MNWRSGVLKELLRVRKILDGSQRASNPNERISEELQKILNFIRDKGFIQDKDYAKITARAKATRALDFKKLIHLKFIEKKRPWSCDLLCSERVNTAQASL